MPYTTKQPLNLCTITRTNLLKQHIAQHNPSQKPSRNLPNNHKSQTQF